MAHIFSFLFLILVIKPLRQIKAERGGEVAAKSWAASEGLRKVPPQYPSVPKFPNLLVKTKGQ